MVAVKHLDVMSKVLHTLDIQPLCDEANPSRLRCSVGNSVIVFEVMCGGRKMAMRIYVRSHRNLKAIYGEHYYPQELLINSSDLECGLADVVLCDWHEGRSLQRVIEELCDSPSRMWALSQMFEEFALAHLAEHWAHGDVKPENIIVTNDGLRFIDFDAAYFEGFTQDDCVETGTRQYQHPLRESGYFGRGIDDYPIALIATALAAMALDSTIGHSVSSSDHLLISPHRAVEGCDDMLLRIENLFAERGDVRHYRIAKLLRSQQIALPQLRALLECSSGVHCRGEELTLEYYNGYWGYALDGKFVIQPLYDIAFDFSEEVALVKVGDVWHFIDVSGEVVITCGRGVGIKPFRNGVTRIVREDGVFEIYRDGRIVMVK
jgi:hypothetical protein